MMAVEITREEGGKWLPFLIDEKRLHFGVLKKTGRSIGRGGTVHAIRFDNGMIWDSRNGWRKTARVRVPMGRAVI